MFHNVEKYILKIRSADDYRIAECKETYILIKFFKFY